MSGSMSGTCVSPRAPSAVHEQGAHLDELGLETLGVALTDTHQDLLASGSLLERWIVVHVKPRRDRGRGGALGVDVLHAHRLAALGAAEQGRRDRSHPLAKAQPS